MPNNFWRLSSWIGNGRKSERRRFAPFVQSPKICTLREMGTDRERRQTIGRGLRLPVNQDGDRIYDDQINRLTVIANETFENFAKGLQSDIEAALILMVVSSLVVFLRLPLLLFSMLKG